MRLFAWVLAAVLPACAGTPPVEVFTRPGCPHCAKAADWLERARSRHPDLEVLKHDVWADPAAYARLERLSREAGLPSATVPTFLVSGRLVVGFRDDASTGAALEELLTGAGAGAPPSSLDLPVFGRVDAGRSGLLAFTLAVGLVDGFNPCAMWVLLFLLSLLVHVKSRAKMAVVAGTFLAVSGGVYYLFMTAWLGAFLALGTSRALQAALGAAALLAAAVHLKDALAPGRGPSLSIPESAKPGLYARMREVVNAENLPAALAAAAALAVGVNLVELLCTAGLPAVYTQVLAAHGLGALERQLYLALYIAAYMLDDGLMTASAVAALSMTRLQERGGKALQALSAAALAALGIALLFKPQWLFWG